MSDTNHLKTGFKSFIKTYIEYDANSRMEYVYEAPADAVNGQACMRTQYVYDTAPSTNVLKTKETVSTWVTATMDI